MLLSKLFSGLFLLLAPLSGQASLLPNGGAEIGIMYWKGVQPVAKDAFSGRFSFESVFTGKDCRIQPWHPVKLSPGEKYTFSAWAKSTGKPAKLSLHIGTQNNPLRTALTKQVQIGSEWTQVRGSYTAPAGKEPVFVCFCIVANGPAKEGSLLLDDIALNAPAATLQTNLSWDQNQLLQKDNEQGFQLDDAYQTAGERIDVLLFDCEELRRQGGTVPEDFEKKARAASDALRREWWGICCQREKFWERHTRASDSAENLDAFDAQIADFTRRALALADDLEKESSTWRKDLVYAPRETPRDFYRRKFSLAIDVEWCLWGVGRLAHPGRNFNAEYQAKAANSLGVDLVTLLLHPLPPPEQKQCLDAFDRWCHAPYLVWTSDSAFEKNDLIDVSYFQQRDKLLADEQRWLEKYQNARGFWGPQIDEPVASDAKIKTVLQDKWENYLKERKSYLDAHHVTQPENTVEWKIFKAEFLGSHLREIYRDFQQKGHFPNVCIMPTYEGQDPARSPYVACCRNLPLAGTDLYRNGSSLEGFHMQLFHNAMAPGKAWMLPGATYSCKTPENYKRSISNGIVHADGIHMWTNTFFSKYRDSHSFWRHPSTRPTLDDRKRWDLFNWYPWAWEVMQERYQFAARNADVLANRTSLADVALVVSERCRFLDKGLFYWNRCLAVYNELVTLHQPFDAIFLENMTDAHWKRYKVVIAPNLSAMTPAEKKALTQYVHAGGVLLTTPDFGTKDEWGRPLQKSPALGERFPSSDIEHGFEEYNLPFTRVLRQEATEKLKKTVTAHSRMPYRVTGLPPGVEMQLQKNDKGQILLQLLDYTNAGEIRGHRLVDAQTGKVIQELPPFTIHQMAILP